MAIDWLMPNPPTQNPATPAQEIFPGPSQGAAGAASNQQLGGLFLALGFKNWNSIINSWGFNWEASK